MDAKFHQAEIVEHIKRCKWEIPRLIISLCTGLKAPWHLTDRVQMKQLWGAKPVLEIAFKSRLWYVITGCSFSRISPTRWKYFFFLQSGRGCARGEKPVLRWVAAKPWSWLGSGSRGGHIKAAKLVSRNHPESINQEKICKRWWTRRWRRWVVSLWPRREVWMPDGLVAVPRSPGDQHGLVGWEGLGAGAKRRRYGMRFRAILRWDRYHSGSITSCPQIPTAHYLSDQGRLILTFVWRQQFINGLMFVDWGGGGGLYLTCQIGYIRCNTLQRHFIPMLISHPELWAIHNFQRIIMKNLFYAKKLQQRFHIILL